jgi:hypothetical protein
MPTYTVSEIATALKEVQEIYYNEILEEIKNGTDMDIIIGLIEHARSLSP